MELQRQSELMPFVMEQCNLKKTPVHTSFPKAAKEQRRPARTRRVSYRRVPANAELCESQVFRQLLTKSIYFTIKLLQIGRKATQRSSSQTAEDCAALHSPAAVTEALHPPLYFASSYSFK